MYDPKFDPLAQLEEQGQQIQHLLNMINMLVANQNTQTETIVGLVRDMHNLNNRLSQQHIRISVVEKEQMGREARD